MSCSSDTGSSPLLAPVPLHPCAPGPWGPEVLLPISSLVPRCPLETASAQPIHQHHGLSAELSPTCPSVGGLWRGPFWRVTDFSHPGIPLTTRRRTSHLMSNQAYRQLGRRGNTKAEIRQEIKTEVSSAQQGIIIIIKTLEC